MTIIKQQPAIICVHLKKIIHTINKSKQNKTHQTYIETFAKIYMYHSDFLNIEKQAKDTEGRCVPNALKYKGYLKHTIGSVRLGVSTLTCVENEIDGVVYLLHLEDF